MSVKIVVVGAGPGGYTAAVTAARLGADVTVVEKAGLGGTCLHWGCIPTKIMKAAADMAAAAGRRETFGVAGDGGFALDIKRLMLRKTSVIGTQARGIEGLFKKSGVRLLSGTASCSHEKTLSVATDDGVEMLSWDRLILAAGSRPMALPALSFSSGGVLSSDDILSIDTVPKSLLIVGGGVIGCEFASIFASFGTAVTVVEACPRLLPIPSIDEGSSVLLQREMKKRGIAVMLNATVTKAAWDGASVTATVAPVTDGSGEKTITAERVLLCVGRAPADDGFESMGLARDKRGWVVVNERMETGVPGVYAVGDMLGPPKIMLAHVASREGMVAAENALGAERAMSYDAVPTAVFTKPEIAAVGLSEQEARERGIPVRTDTVLMRGIGMAHVLDELSGQATIVSEAETGRIVGVQLAGAHATELIAEAGLAVRNRLTVRDMAETIHAHPTLAEIMQEAALAACGRAVHG